MNYPLAQAIGTYIETSVLTVCTDVQKKTEAQHAKHGNGMPHPYVDTT